MSVYCFLISKTEKKKISENVPDCKWPQIRLSNIDTITGDNVVDDFNQRQCKTLVFFLSKLKSY